MELIEIVKKRLEAKGWDFASDYWDDEELTSLHEVILETEAALRQPLVSGRSEQFICPCCGSNKTYKTDAIHCKRCAVTTEI